jgi:hypothetical protein
MADDTSGWGWRDVRPGVAFWTIECGAPSCRARSLVDPRTISRGATRERLEAAIRCPCGGRGGRIYPGWNALGVAAERRGGCYLFHA